MKKILLAASVLVGVLFFGKAESQINISINIGSQPAWGPTGYNHVDYYYLPDINSYYNVNTAQYIYFHGNKWRYAKRLPNRYRNYDVYNSYKVVVNRANPYLNNRFDIENYSQYKGRRNSQPILRDSRGANYKNNNGNNKWKSNNANDGRRDSKATQSRNNNGNSDKGNQRGGRR
ncbi:MAG TPA: hypothetical protein VL053_11805 [Arachidicoccus sp.]|nr:hypothetical protein [Arachidicoccus sp.]